MIATGTIKILISLVYLVLINQSGIDLYNFWISMFTLLENPLAKTLLFLIITGPVWLVFIGQLFVKDIKRWKLLGLCAVPLSLTLGSVITVGLFLALCWLYFNEKIDNAVERKELTKNS